MRNLMKIKKIKLSSVFKLKVVEPEYTIANDGNIYQAKIGAHRFYTLNDAIMSVKTTEKTFIKLLSDSYLYDFNIHIPGGTNIVLDLAGHSISSNNDDGTIFLEGALTIVDTSKNQCGLIENTYSNGMGIHFYQTGSLRMYGGTITGCCALYSWNEFFTPNVTIIGGTVKGRHFGISFRNSENLIVKKGIVTGGVSAFNIWNK